MVGFHVNLDRRSGGAMSWNDWLRLLERRYMRCRNAQIPPQIVRGVWLSMAEWIDQRLFRGTRSPRQQLQHYRDNIKRNAKSGGGGGPAGLYSEGGAAGSAEIINAWERLGDGDAVKKLISKAAKKKPELHADVYSTRSKQGFLASMYSLGPYGSIGRGVRSIQVRTDATMTPYDPTARSAMGRSGPQPIMHYFRYGWRGRRASMRPRWPNGLAGLIKGARPYQPYLSAISNWIING